MERKILSFILLFIIFVPMIIPAESSEQKLEERIITFTKYLPDGKIERFDRVVSYTGKNFSKKISDMCAKMAREDKAIQRFLNETNINVYFIMSAGTGLHFMFPPSLLKLSLWSIALSLFPSGIYCNYHGNEAETDIMPVIPSGSSTTIYGEHKLLTLGFVGIVGWDGLFSFSDTGFAGFTLFIWTSGITT
ncbi:MAG: hypothetical protein U9O96_02705 [Candidatus Thermoplasmatota archaeon]|nr:hypothetical protein [Candidatus Thermoplasmatota archaeon]